MLKQVINSSYLAWYRKLYIKSLLNEVESKSREGYNYTFCCSIENLYTFFICWKELKEVSENMESITLYKPDYKKHEPFDCTRVWFDGNKNRANFLKECLTKFN